MSQEGTSYTDFKLQFPQKPVKPTKPSKPGLFKRLFNVAKIVYNSVEDSIEAHKSSLDTDSQQFEDSSAPRWKQHTETRTNGQIIDDTFFEISHTVQNTKYKIERLQYLQAKEQYKLDRRLCKLQQREQNIDRKNFCFNGKNQFVPNAQRYNQLDLQNQNPSYSATPDKFSNNIPQSIKQYELGYDSLYEGTYRKGDVFQNSNRFYEAEFIEDIREINSLRKDNRLFSQSEKSFTQVGKNPFEQDFMSDKEQVTFLNNSFTASDENQPTLVNGDRDQSCFFQDSQRKDNKKARFVSTGNPLYTVDLNNYLYKKYDNKERKQGNKKKQNLAEQLPPYNDINWN